MPTQPGFSADMMQMLVAQMRGGGAAAPQWKVPPTGQKQGPVSIAPAPAEAAPVVRKGGGAAALDMSKGFNVETISAKIKEVAMGIIGDDDEIEVDMPLMQAGLTSNTAVLLRDEMSVTIPGVNL